MGTPTTTPSLLSHDASDTHNQKEYPMNPIHWLFPRSVPKPPILLAATPPRTGERTLLGVENLLQSIAVPEPFSLELAGDADGVTVLARCRDGEVVREQIAAHYPQARIEELSGEEDPLHLAEGEQAWGLTLTSTGPEYVPLRTFRDDDLLDPGSDPLIALLGALSALRPGERVVARLLLRSLGPDWSQPHQERAYQPAVEQRPAATSAPASQAKTEGSDGLALAVLGVVGLVAFKGWDWVQSGEPLKAALLAAGVLAASVAGAWFWRRWKCGRNRIHDPALIKEKVSRIAFEAELQVTAILPQDGTRERARDLLGRVIAAYHHYDHPVGARFRDGSVRPVLPVPSIQPSPPGLFGRRSVLGVREVAALWHPPGAGDETPLVERSGAVQSMPGVDYKSMLSELGKYGASFVLATQSLAKLADLSPTMQDTVLANTGCLAVFQVAGSDARKLVWELGRERVTEEDITSQPVHHCYVRATVGSERMPAFSMKVLKPEGGDPQIPARIRAGVADYTTPARDIDERDAGSRERVARYHDGLDALASGTEALPAPGPENSPPAAPERRKQRSRRNRTGGGAEAPPPEKENEA